MIMKSKLIKGFLLLYLMTMTITAIAQRPFNCLDVWHWLILEENYDEPGWNDLMDAYIKMCM